MIEAKNITKFYKVQGFKKTVFEDLNLVIPKGGRFALMGPNGAGKSTLLRVLTGVEHPNRGQVIKHSSISWPVGLATGFISQLTAKENVQFVCRLYSYSRSDRREAITYVRDFAEIGKYFDMPMSTYSSGMRSRVAFALSMAFDFDFYVVDEAMSAGDPNFKKKCDDAFNNRIKDKGLIMVSHQVSNIKSYCTEGIYINHGKIEFYKDIDLLIKRYQT